MVTLCLSITDRDLHKAQFGSGARREIASI
jgi:hypothetical protein